MKAWKPKLLVSQWRMKAVCGRGDSGRVRVGQWSPCIEIPSGGGGGGMVMMNESAYRSVPHGS